MSKERSAWLKSHHGRSAGEPIQWIFKALDFFHAAQMLHAEVATHLDAPSPQVDGLTLEDLLARPLPLDGYSALQLIRGVCLELSAKAILVMREPTLVETEDFGKRWPADHKLRSLFERATIATSDDEQELLLGLEAQLQWAARYPAPRTFDAEIPLPLAVKRSARIFEALFDRVYRQVVRERLAEGESPLTSDSSPDSE